MIGTKGIVMPLRLVLAPHMDDESMGCGGLLAKYPEDSCVVTMTDSGVRRSAEHDRAMVCGSPAMIKDCCTMLDQRGFKVSPYIGAMGDYVIAVSYTHLTLPTNREV